MNEERLRISGFCQLSISCSFELMTSWCVFIAAACDFVRNEEFRAELRSEIEF